MQFVNPTGEDLKPFKLRPIIMLSSLQNADKKSNNSLDTVCTTTSKMSEMSAVKLLNRRRKNKQNAIKIVEEESEDEDEVYRRKEVENWDFK